MSRVPFVDLSAQWRSVGPAVTRAMEAVHADSSYILGPAVDEFETAFASYVGAARAVGVSSGTRAIALILRALGIGPGAEVIVPAMTFMATAGAVSEAGATPRLVDVDVASGLIDPAAVAAAVGPRTAAIIAVHLYGQPAALGELSAIAERGGLALIEDACQAHGARYGAQRVGSFGRAAAFSFYPSKNLGAYGDAGAVTTHDRELADRVARLRHHGTASKYVHAEVGGTHRIDTLQAAALAVKLPLLDGWNAARAAHARRYQAALGGLGSLALPAVLPDRSHVFHIYAVRAAMRDELRTRLAQAGIDSGIHYPVPLHLQPALASLGHAEGDFPGAEALARTTLSLPMYAELDDTVPERVAGVLAEARA